MKIASKILAGSVACIATMATLLAAPASKEARVTQIIREVNLLPSNSDPRAAALNDKVSEETGVRTGGDSRSELTFSDLTITRLGANTVFSFNKSGRTANVDNGSILLRVPKDSGGGSIRSSAITVAITGTTVIFEKTADGESRLITLEGSARAALNTKPKEWRKVAPGQMLDVPNDATTLPTPVNIDLDELMRTHPLIVDFRPLPSEPLIRQVVRRSPPPTTTAPVNPVTAPTPTGPRGNPPPPATTPWPTRPPWTYPPRPTPIPKPSPTPTHPPATNPSPTFTPKGSPKPTRPPANNPKPTPTPTAGPILRTQPKPSPSPTAGPILRTVPTQTTRPAPSQTRTPPRFKKKQQSSSFVPR